MKEEAKTLSNLRKYFEDKKEVSHLFVFGSFANATNTKKSDLDIVLIKNTEDRFLDRYKKYLDIEDAVGVSVDLFIYTESEWSTVKERSFFRNTPKLQIL